MGNAGSKTPKTESGKNLPGLADLGMWVRAAQLCHVRKAGKLATSEFFTMLLVVTSAAVAVLAPLSWWLRQDSFQFTQILGIVAAFLIAVGILSWEVSKQYGRRAAAHQDVADALAKLRSRIEAGLEDTESIQSEWDRLRLAEPFLPARELHRTYQALAASRASQSLRRWVLPR